MDEMEVMGGDWRDASTLDRRFLHRIWEPWPYAVTSSHRGRKEKKEQLLRWA